MKITVTKDDIQGAQRREANNCPIARALRRQGAGPLVVGPHPDAMTYWETWVVGNAHAIVATLPLGAAQFARNFDMGVFVQPFSFWLDLGEKAEPFEMPVAKSDDLVAV